MSNSFAVSFAARARGLLIIPGLFHRLETINPEAKGDAALLIEEAARNLQVLLTDLRGKRAIDINGPCLNEDLDAYESVVKMLEDHVGAESMIKMVKEKFENA